MRRFFLIAVPYAWLLSLFLIPFIIVFKISLSDLALSIPPYSPTAKDGISTVPPRAKVRLRIGASSASGSTSEWDRLP